MVTQRPTRRIATTPRSPRSKPLVSDVGAERKKPQVDVLKLVMNIIVAVLAVAVLATGTLLVLRNVSAFGIEKLEAASTEHLTSDDIARLANIGTGTTLLNVDDAAVREGLARNPWVGRVDIERNFPDTLTLRVHERKVTMIVMMGSSGIGWYVGEGNVWVQPVAVSAAGGRSVNEVALSMALEEGALLVTDVPSSLEPEAGTVVTDETLNAILAYLDELPQELSDRIVSFSAASPDALSCMLESGIEVSLGSATDIATKGSIVMRLIEEHPGELTYINVRTPSNPSYRSISSSTVQPGTGTSGDAMNDPVGTDTQTPAETTPVVANPDVVTIVEPSAEG